MQWHPVHVGMKLDKVDILQENYLDILPFLTTDNKLFNQVIKLTVP